MESVIDMKTLKTVDGHSRQTTVYRLINKPQTIKKYYVQHFTRSMHTDPLLTRYEDDSCNVY
jgi:hypothetical protein